MAKETLRDRIAEEFVKSLSEDRIPWQTMWVSQRPFNAYNSKQYRGLNALWLSYVASERGYTDPRWCTFKQAQEREWRVKKGEKASSVEFWSIYDKKQRKNLTFWEADKIVAADSSRKDDMRIVAKEYYVFNACQIDGIPELEKAEIFTDIADVRAKRDVLLHNMGLSFYEGGDQAYYRPSADSITMPPERAFPNSYAYMSVFLHEAGHATGHESRLNRDLSGGFGSESYAKEELRAEIASAFTAQALGFGAEGAQLTARLDNHKAYIQSWIQAIRHKPPELFAAIKDAEKISDYLLEKGELLIPQIEEEHHESLDEQIESALAQKSNSASFVNLSDKTLESFAPNQNR